MLRRRDSSADASDIMTLRHSLLAKTPAAYRIDIDDHGNISGIN